MIHHRLINNTKSQSNDKYYMIFVYILILLFLFFPDLEKYINKKINTILKLLTMTLIFLNIYRYGTSATSNNTKTKKSVNLFKNKTVHLETINKKKRSVSEKVKKVVASNQKWRCKQCEELLSASYEVDHICPLYKGGTNEINNLQALCRNCHGEKTIHDSLLE